MSRRHNQEAADRVQKFLDARRYLNGLHPEEIINAASVGSDHEIVTLTVSDLQRLVRAQRTLHALTSYLQEQRQKGRDHGSA